MSQGQQVFSHLKRHGSITPMEALNQYGCMRLAARIEELRTKGHRIETDMSNKFATYRYYSKTAA